ncbi:MAG TPA: hypothetical protein VJZ49_15160, partial [Syntrophales bacterium]|nr:hypothetical protein [Syntrophales bacterium]
ILVMAYHIIKNGVPYKELGKNYLLHRREDKIVKNHIKRLRDLGYEVERKMKMATQVNIIKSNT